MKSIIAKLYITIVSVIIILGLLFLVNEIWSSRSDYKDQSLVAADKIKSVIEENWYKHKNFSNDSLKQSLENLDDPNIHSIIIYSHDKGIQLPLSKHNMRSFLLNSLIKNDPNWNDKPEYSLSTLENFVVSTPLQLTDRGYSFDLIYNILSRDKIQGILKNAIIAIVGLFVLTILVIIIFSIIKSKYVVNEYDEDSFKPMGGHTDLDHLDDNDLITKTDLESLHDDSAEDSDTSQDEDDLGSLDGFDFDTDESLDSGDDEDFSIGNDLDEFDLGDDNLDENLEDEFDLETDEIDDFAMDLEEPETEIDDFDMDLEEPETEIDDFDMDLEEPDTEEIKHHDDFSLELDEPEVDDSLEDFDLDDTSDIDIVDDLEDFDLDTETEDIDVTDDLDGFDLEDDSQDQEIETEEFDLEDAIDDLDQLAEESPEIPDSELENFSLDEDETLDLDEEDSVQIKIEKNKEEPKADVTETDSLEDFQLGSEFDLETETESIDEIEIEDQVDLDLEDSLDDGLGDFDLESEDLNLEDSMDDDLGDFDLESEDINLEDSMDDDLGDLDLDTELGVEDSFDEDLDLDSDFDLDNEDNLEETNSMEDSETRDILDDLDDLDLENKSQDKEGKVYNLSDYGVDDDGDKDGYSLEEFALDTDETSELEDFQIDEEEFQLIEDLDDMDLSPEVIEASTDMNDLPSMELESDLLGMDKIESSKFRSKDEVAPELSSLLEKAGVEEKDLSVTVIDISSDRYEGLNLIEEHFENNDNIFEMENDLVAVISDDTNSEAINNANSLLQRAESSDNTIRIGISSMSGRRVGENRLMGEAYMAVKKANEMSKDMLAFRPDPEKYKEYIKKS